MRVTRENVAYFFWPATASAVVLLGLFVSRLFGFRGESMLYVGLPAVAILLVCVVLVVPAAAHLQQIGSDDPALLAGLRTARIVQACVGVLGVAMLIAEFIVPSPLSSALMVLFCLLFYLQYLGFFALVRRFG